jgi:DNA-binding SARP family transcriptional activator
MAHLSLSLLGPFQALLDAEPVTTFESTKVRALLAYLVVEADRTHRRDVLAGLLWPEWLDRDALSNLRYALYNLRQVIGDRTAEPPFLLITRHTLQFNITSDHWLDVATFEQCVESASQRGGDQPSAISHLQSAISLYRGCFLEGFFVRDSPAFEEWALFTRERLARQMSAALHRLAAAHEARGDYEQAQAYARRQLELEPWQEEAHRRVMRLLALGGQRGAALVHYETCRRLLAEELDVEPARATTALYESIRDGTFYDRETKRRRAKVFAVPLSPSLVSPSSFVGRERELASLDGFLDLALAGQGRVVFVTGEAGSGKTVLLGEFTRRAMAAHSDLVVAAGRCNAQSGIGDPYLPFREILQLLTGDVEHQRAGGAITGQHARRLWSLLPDVVRALVDDGPDLVDLLLPGAALALRAEVFAPEGAAWRARLEELVKGRPAEEEADQVALHQTDLFEQVTRVLQSLARQNPLILVVDDLQWADAGSVSLLFHLGRRLAGSRILVVGAYRPGDLALIHQDPKGFGKPLGSGDRHPLEAVVHEFQRDLGDIQVDLDQAGGRPFVEALLDSEPNGLGAAFREAPTRP